MAQTHHGQSNGAYQFKQAHPGGIIDVVNSDGYVMAQYNDRTGKTSWQRVLPITQRESIEKWLHQQFPVVTSKPSSKK
ncbi:MAG TPA: hypothetical protein VGN17_10025 [Bryobacteraceae bacterium]|jgi:hypothetical protein